MQFCSKSWQKYPCSEFDLCGSMPIKPRKSKDLCRECRKQWYEENKGGCWSYKDAKVELTSNIPSKSTPPPYDLTYKLTCFIKRW